MRYEQIWDAVDKLAKSQGMSPSGLAKSAGLDATTFNKSKRIRPDGKKRWPSLDSLNKVMEVCNITFEQFYNLFGKDDKLDTSNYIPFCKSSVLGKQQITNKDIDMSKWNRTVYPDIRDSLYAIEVDSTNWLPIYKSGATLIMARNSDIRRGDRVVIYCRNETILIKEFVHRTPSNLVIRDINSAQEEYDLPIAEMQLIHRILWASQ